MQYVLVQVMVIVIDVKKYYEALYENFNRYSS
jgi:hypothetical protein